MKRFELTFADFKWVDIEAPAAEDLTSLAQEFSLPPNTVQTCLDPEHLPQCQFFEKSMFFILRHQDLEAEPDAVTMQELSTKLVFFVGFDFVLTIHRLNLPCINAKKERAQVDKMTLTQLVRSLAVQTLRSFEPALDELDEKSDVIEDRVFSLMRKNILREGYIVKRKASSYRKIFKFTQDILLKLPKVLDISQRDIYLVQEPLDKLIFYSSEIYEQITGLLNLHLSLMSQKTNEASFRTNEVMRVLTVFSIFFLPLNFIAGIYGMNFEYMPELKQPHGYYITLGFMIFVVLGITYWIYRKGWLRKDNLQRD